MDIIEAMKGRQSVRAFLDKAVPKETIIKIFEAARFAPSGVNHQPWEVVVLNDTLKQKLGDAIIQARDSGTPENPDYDYYPNEWFDPYKSRRKVCGAALYGALHIEYGDKEARKKQWYKNYRFFNAPVGLVFYLDAKLSRGSWMDMGSFLQNVMLAARAFELETCPQASIAEYPDIVRDKLGLPKEKLIVCGMALGFADWSDPVNQYRTEREDPSTFLHWI